MKKELKDVLHLYMGCEISAAHISTAILTHKLTNASHIAIDLVLSCEHYKPILRPLSDLVKEIEVGDEKFVPLRKLHEWYETNYFSEDKNLMCLQYIDRVISCDHNHYKYGGGEDFILKHMVPTGNMGDLVYSFTYDPKLKRFAVRDETYQKPLGVGHQLDMFLKLLEWNFDLFGLIESGQAIDKNKL